VRKTTSVKGYDPSQMVALCNVWARHYSLCDFVLHSLIDADVEFDFVFITSAYSQCVKDSCKQHLAAS